MKRFALLSILCLFAGVNAAHASSINPITDGFTINVGNTVLTNANATYNSLTNTLTFSDSTSTYTFAEVNASPLINALSITRTCTTLNVNGCSSSTVSVSNASLLDGLIQANVLLGATLQASATAGVSNLVFANTTLGVAAQSAIVGYQPIADPSSPTNSPVPEPGTVSLVMSGVLSMAYAAKRRLLNA